MATRDKPLQNKLRAVREAKGWPTTRLAFEARINFFQVYQYELGKNEPGIRNALRLGRALGLSVEDIWSLEDDHDDEKKAAQEDGGRETF